MSTKRQILIDTATELFSSAGFHATGIDLIAKRANVSKKTMYHHFRSKEQLIAATLRQHEQNFTAYIEQSIGAIDGGPIERLLGIFDVAHSWFETEDFYGCLFINAVAEYPDENSEIRTVCAAAKTSTRRCIQKLIEETDLSEPERLSTSLALLFEGSIVSVYAAKNATAAQEAKRAAKVLIEHSAGLGELT